MMQQQHEMYIQGGDVNAVLKLVMQLAENGEAQLTILGIAMVVACRSCGVPKERAMQVLEEIFDRGNFKLIPFSELDKGTM